MNFHQTDPYTEGLQVYCVGGAVRDALLGLPEKDRDWVVVGSSVQTMIDRGFLAVGRDFPVFLHPVSHEEYALARTERKTGPGYVGFSIQADPHVTLEEDLQRRDLTINAIARTLDGKIIDPYKGLLDLQNKTLRHISPSFCEDPVRILRLARFAAKLPNFYVNEETITLCRTMFFNRETQTLVPERVWRELSAGMMSAQPSKMFEILTKTYIDKDVLPEFAGITSNDNPSPAPQHPLKQTKWEWSLCAIDLAAKQETTSLAVRFAALLRPLSLPENTLKHICQRLRVPRNVLEVACSTAREANTLDQAIDLPCEALIDLTLRLDGLRKPARLQEILAACAIGWATRPGIERLHPPSLSTPYPQGQRICEASEIMRSLPFPSAGLLEKTSPQETVRVARLAAIRKKFFPS